MDQKDLGEASVSGRSIGSTLLVGMRGNDPEAWRSITFLFGPLIDSWCRRAGLQESDRADVGQEVFRTLAAHRDEFRRDRPGDTFRGWLWTVTQNKIKDFWRRHAKQPAADGGTTHQGVIGQLPALDDESVAPSSADDDRGLLRRSLELVRLSFEEKTWQAFWLTTVEEQTAAEAGAALGMSSGAVYVAKSRVIAKLRAELGDFFDEGFQV